jgi:hypothetical protein
MEASSEIKVSMEPPTTRMLLGQYTPEDCRRMFPKQPTAAMALDAVSLRAAKNLVLEHAHKELDARDCCRKNEEKDDTSHKDDCAWRVEHRRLRVEELLISAKLAGVQKVGVRLDWELTHPVLGTRWGDHFIVHPSGRSRRKEEYRYVQDRHALEEGREDGLTEGRIEVALGEVGPWMTKMEATKKARFAGLMDVAGRQVKKMPEFLAPGVSTFGTLSPDAVKLQEYLVAAYRLRLETETDPCGTESIATRTAGLRARFRNRVTFAALNGVSAMQDTAGAAWTQANKKQYVKKRQRGMAA